MQSLDECEMGESLMVKQSLGKKKRKKKGSPSFLLFHLDHLNTIQLETAIYNPGKICHC